MYVVREPCCFGLNSIKIELGNRFRFFYRCHYMEFPRFRLTIRSLNNTFSNTNFKITSNDAECLVYCRPEHNSLSRRKPTFLQVCI